MTFIIVMIVVLIVIVITIATEDRVRAPDVPRQLRRGHGQLRVAQAKHNKRSID